MIRGCGDGDGWHEDVVAFAISAGDVLLLDRAKDVFDFKVLAVEIVVIHRC